MTAAQLLGKFAADLAFQDIPSEVGERAKDCIIDTIAVATFGSQLPWSRIVADFAKGCSSGGFCSLIGFADARVQAPYAALANGVSAHAFEQDSTFDPGNGPHPGATLVPAILAAAEDAGCDGKRAIVAFVAGCETLHRVGGASYNSRIQPETLGFHSGLTGTFGAAVAAGLVYGLNEGQLTNALGIAGSLCSGIIAFTKAKQGGMVKRLHLGRTAEAGILAARLASAGYTGPETVLEGKFGFLDAYCRDGEQQRLSAGFGSDWGTLRVCMKRYPFHMSSHTAVQALRELVAEFAFRADDVAGILVEVGSKKSLSHNYILEPGDMMQAQYSVPFCVAYALFRDPEDPTAFDESARADANIRALCRKVELRAFTEGQHTRKSSRVTVRLKDGRELTRGGDSFRGMPSNPLNRVDLRHRFMLQTAAAMDAAVAGPLFERLENLDTQSRFSLAM